MAANLALIPHFSYLGACWATLATQLFYFIIIFSRLRRYLSFAGLVRLTWRPAVATGVMGLGVTSLRGLPLGFIILAGMVIYALMLLVTKTLTTKELQSLKEVWQVRHVNPQPAG